jgi:stress-induced morphogen
MPIKQSELQKILTQNFPEAKIEIIDLAGDDNHYSVIIADKIFTGKNRIEQHRLVNKALNSYLDSGVLHAMQLKTISA